MIIQGKAYWAKVLGEPGWGYKNQYKEWSIDVTLDAKTMKKLIAEGVAKDKIKNKGDDRGNFLTFKRRETKKDGNPAKPFLVIGPDGKTPWPQTELIGNGSVVNAKLILNENEDGTMRPSLLKLQVVEHVPYGDGEDFTDYTDGGEDGSETWDSDDE